MPDEIPYEIPYEVQDENHAHTSVETAGMEGCYTHLSISTLALQPPRLIHRNASRLYHMPFI